MRKRDMFCPLAQITPKMRSVLLDWLVEVSQQFTLLQETLFMAVALFDRFMSRCAGRISKKTLQLVGIGALFVASKYEEMYPPSVGKNGLDLS
jgi:hypothetical protein